jgi:hypothetical protein
MVWWQCLNAGNWCHERHEKNQNAYESHHHHHDATRNCRNVDHSERNVIQNTPGAWVLNELAFFHNCYGENTIHGYSAYPKTTTTTPRSGAVRGGTSKTVCLNVGGHIYEFSRDILDRHPDSMLSHMMSERWQQTATTHQYTTDTTPDAQQKIDNDGIPFIDRNGQRFGYILDLCRDGVVYLPVTVSPAALQMDLEYFGLEQIIKDDDKTSRIRPSNVVEATEIALALGDDTEEQVLALEQTISQKKYEIKELEQKRAAIQLADVIFRRFRLLRRGKKGSSVTIKFQENENNYKNLAFTAQKNEAFFKERLNSVYGITLVEMEDRNFRDYIITVREAPSKTSLGRSDAKARNYEH